MFILKLKGDTNTQRVNQVTLKVKGSICIIESQDAMEYILKGSEPEDLQIQIEDKFYAVWNLYFKEFNQAFLCEGLDDE